MLGSSIYSLNPLSLGGDRQPTRTVSFYSMSPRNILLLFFILPITVTILFVFPAQSQPYFSDVATQIGITGVHDRSFIACSPDLGSGSAWADYDNDGDIDLYVTNEGGPCYLYRNDGDTDGDHLPNFIETAAAAGVADSTGIGQSSVFIDYDNDGDEDLFVTNWGFNTLYKNQLIETAVPVFIDVTATAGLADYGRTVTSAWGDYDGDSFLDVYLAKHLYCTPNDQNEDQLYKNNGDGTFTNVTRLLCPGGVAPCDMTSGLGFSAGWVDYDNDVDLDLYLVNDYLTPLFWPNVLWRNDGPDGNGGWIFTDVSDASGTGARVNGMGLGVGDYDNNGFMDFAFSNIGPNILLKNNGDGTFADVSHDAGIEREFTKWGDVSVTWGTVFFDYDNDQWLDLFIVAGMISGINIRQPDILFRNKGDGTFTDISNMSGVDDTLRGRCASIVDFDHDGYVDLFVGNLHRTDLGNTAPFRMYHNQTSNFGNTNHWMTVTVEGTTSNRDAIGTRLYATTPDGVTQIRDINSGPTYGGGDYRAAYFGLGANSTAVLTVRWPDGTTKDIGVVQSNQEIHLVESIPCADITSMGTRCIGGALKTIQVRVNLLNNVIHAGQSVTIAIDGSTYSAPIVSNGTSSRASLSIPGWSVGAHTVSLVDPVGCLADKHPQCVDPAKGGPQWDDDNEWDLETRGLPGTTILEGNYPNPFNPSTIIRYALSKPSHVILRTYNMLGQLVTTLVDEQQNPGYKSVVWDGKDEQGASVASGIYIYRISVVSSARRDLVPHEGDGTTGGFTDSKRMLLIK